MATHKPPAPVESLNQAIQWNTLKNHYIDAGLCNGCAGQAAYGHQSGAGFTRIHPPCPVCRGIRLPAALIRRHGARGQRWLDGGYVDPGTPS